MVSTGLQTRKQTGTQIDRLIAKLSYKNRTLLSSVIRIYNNKNCFGEQYLLSHATLKQVFQYLYLSITIPVMIVLFII